MFDGIDLVAGINKGFDICPQKIYNVVVFIFAVRQVRGSAVFNIFTGTKVRGFC